MLNETSLRDASLHLASLDPDLARILDAHGPPPLWDRPAGFATLLYIILEQQVSLASARAAFQRLESAISPVSPQNFLTLSDEVLKTIGFSRQKAGYGRILAQAVIDGALDLDRLHTLDDGPVRTELVKIKGIGQWTADIYLMEALLRPDIWPAGDLALAAAVRRAKQLEKMPAPAHLYELGEAYRPWRSVAARMFWHHYLSEPIKRSARVP